MIIDFFKRLFGMYDSTGLKYAPSKLNSIARAIRYMPIEEQAKYADAVCVSHIKDAQWQYNQFAEVDPEEIPIYEMNATAVGNCAYLAINSPVAEVRQKCSRILDRLKQFKQ